jgi:hypothetical protein
MGNHDYYLSQATHNKLDDIKEKIERIGILTVKLEAYKTSLSIFKHLSNFATDQTTDTLHMSRMYSEQLEDKIYEIMTEIDELVTEVHG